ncbi:defensin-like [Ixodes scapularis]|uniref:defensin-like n=1 Tax=Ixodes scapularis TaxID=6945 RepID=UPI001C38D4E0|nr:defensin-like [Ixodes scapularis]
MRKTKLRAKSRDGEDLFGRRNNLQPGVAGYCDVKGKTLAVKRTFSSLDAGQVEHRIINFEIMKIIGVALIALLVAGAFITSRAQREEKQVAHVRVRRGFGCPFDEDTCLKHCESTGGYGGFWSGPVMQSCGCYYIVH